MAVLRVSDLPVLSANQVSTADVLMIVDVSEGISKRVQVSSIRPSAADVESVLDAYYGNTVWRDAPTPTDAMTIEATLDTYYGNTVWRDAPAPTDGVTIEATLDTYYGNTVWRSNNLASLTDVDLASIGVGDDGSALIYSSNTGTWAPGVVSTSSSGIILGTTITSSRNITDADLAGNILYDIDSIGAIVLTIPAGLVGTEPVTFQTVNSGIATFTAGAGVTIQAIDSLTSITYQGGSAILIPKGGDVYGLIGVLA